MSEWNLVPWTSGDKQGQFDCGREDGRRDAESGEGWPDGIEIDTPYNRGYKAGREEVQVAK